MRRAGERGANRWEHVSWEETLAEMAVKLEAVKRESSSEYFGMMQGTRRPYTGFASRFAYAFGSPNFTNVAHVCYFPRWMASVLTVGQLPVCDFYGFGGEKARLRDHVGMQCDGDGGPPDDMCGGTVQRALREAERVIVVDPRRIRPAQKAHRWLQLRPGTDGAPALAMINTIIAEDLANRDFVREYTKGFKRLARHVRDFTPEWAAPITGLEAESIRAAARTCATTKPACMLWGNAVDMSACNFQTARSLLILRAISGNLDVPGGDVFWVPPAQVRQRSMFENPEVSGVMLLPLKKYRRSLNGKRFPLLATTHPPTFWNSIVSGDPYRLRAMWIMGANPLVTMTHSRQVEQALRLLEFTVVSDFFLTPTAQMSDLVLPAATWLEQATSAICIRSGASWRGARWHR